MAKTPLTLEEGAALKVLSLVEEIEDLDDTQSVFYNLDVTEDLMMSYEAAG